MKKQKVKKQKLQKDYYEILGILKDGSLVMLDYIFIDTLYDKPFCGATGTSFSPVSQEQIDERNNPENVKEEYKYLWQESVKSGTTEDSLDDFIERLINDPNTDGEFFGHDNSYVHKIPEAIKEKYFPEAATFECTGGGRMFDADMKASDFKVLLRPDLLKEIVKVEGKNTPRSSRVGS